MNKFYLLLTALCVSFYANVSGQCTPDGSVTSGVSPSSSAVPCADRTAAFSQTFTFVVPSSLGITTVKFDSITNLPSGLTYAFNQNPAEYAAGSRGCFIVSGTPGASVPCGQYKTRIYVTITSSFVGTVKGPMDSIATAAGISGFDPIYIRVKDIAGVCPTINNNNQAFTADATCGIAAGGAPIVTTTASTGIAQTTADLNGIVNPNGLTTAVSFEWGLTTSYGNTATPSPSSLVGANGINVTASVNGLQPSTLYHFRVKGVNTSGTTNGNDLTFTTLAPQTAGNCTANPNQVTLFEPLPDQIACIRKGQAYNEVMYINFTTIANQVSFDSVRIDSLGNMPAGINAYPNQVDKTYRATESGCIQITGTSNADCGQYKFKIYVTIWTSFSPNPIKGELYDIATSFGFGGAVPQYYHRVTACPAPTCPALDASQTVAFVPAAICTNPGALVLPIITTTGVTTFCQGNSVKLSAGNNYTSYEWSNGSTDSTATATTSASYNVTVSNGCETGSAAAPVAVTVKPTPTAAFTGTGNVLTATPAVANYKWVRNDTIIPGATSQTYTITQGGDYSVIVTLGGCSDTSAVRTLTYTFVGVEEIAGIKNLTLVPNPANSFITVRASVAGSTVNEITLHDIVGRAIQTILVNHASGSSFEHKIDLSGISNGTYFIQVNTEKGKVTRSFVKN